MRFRTAPAIAAVLLTAACASTAPAAAPTPSVVPTHSQGTTTGSERPTPTAAPSQPAGAAGAPTLAWGKQAFTVGSAHPFDKGATPGAPLEITPTSVVYLTKTSTDTPAAGLFVIVVTKQAAPMAAATATAPMTGGGWTWIAPDGQATDILSGNASSVTVSSMHGDLAPAGSFIITTEVFDVSATAKGGTLQYIDGGGVTFRWKAPAADSGPQVPQVEQELTQ